MQASQSSALQALRNSGYFITEQSSSLLCGASSLDDSTELSSAVSSSTGAASGEVKLFGRCSRPPLLGRNRMQSRASTPAETPDETERHKSKHPACPRTPIKRRSYRYALCPHSRACNMHLKLDCLQLLVLVVTLLFQARVLLQALVKIELELLLFRIGPASCKRLKSLP